MAMNESNDHDKTNGDDNGWHWTDTDCK
jgi:hypothetical protein